MQQKEAKLEELRSQLVQQVQLTSEYNSLCQQLRMLQSKITVKRSQIEGMCKEMSMYQQTTSLEEMKFKLKQQTESMLKWIQESQKWIQTIDEMAREERKKNEQYRRQLRFRMKSVRA